MIVVNDAVPAGEILILSNPPEMPRPRIKIDLKPVDAVRIPQSGEWVTARPPYRAADREREIRTGNLMRWALTSLPVTSKSIFKLSTFV